MLPTNLPLVGLARLFYIGSHGVRFLPSQGSRLGCHAQLATATPVTDLVVHKAFRSLPLSQQNSRRQERLGFHCRQAMQQHNKEGTSYGVMSESLKARGLMCVDHMNGIAAVSKSEGVRWIHCRGSEGCKRTKVTLGRGEMYVLPTPPQVLNDSQWLQPRCCTAAQHCYST